MNTSSFNSPLIKDALGIKPSEILCDNPFFQTQTKNHAGCQIDYMIQTIHNTIYLCKIKFSKNPIGYEAIEEMEKKIKQLVIPRHFSYRNVLIYVNGVVEKVEESQFFSNIICLGDFL